MYKNIIISSLFQQKRRNKSHHYYTNQLSYFMMGLVITKSDYRSQANLAVFAKRKFI